MLARRCVALKACLRDDARGSTVPVAEWIAMHLLCVLGWHRPESTTIRNEGRHFGRCRRCKSDLIEVGLGWKRAPRGYRVVWKKADADVPPAAPDAYEPPKFGARIGAQLQDEVEPDAEVEAEIAAPAPLVRRARANRRDGKAGALPSHLAGKERRGKGAARKSPGKKPDRPPA
jgi:hypothetical protein